MISIEVGRKKRKQIDQKQMCVACTGGNLSNAARVNGKGTMVGGFLIFFFSNPTSLPVKHDWLNINTGKHGHGLVQGLMGVWMNHSMFFFVFCCSPSSFINIFFTIYDMGSI